MVTLYFLREVGLVANPLTSGDRKSVEAPDLLFACFFTYFTHGPFCIVPKTDSQTICHAARRGGSWCI